MGEHNIAPLRLFLVILGAVLFFFAAITWAAPVEPYRVRLIAAGLGCWAISTFF